MNVPATKQPTAATIEDVLIRGDLSKLTEQQRTEYYMRVCHSLGLNPLTRPFDYLTLSGKLVLYAKRDAADQLRKINGISIEIVGKPEMADGLLTVHARAKDKTGRTDEDYGVVAFKGGGNEFAANAVLKCVTKAKRRVTLSISGLGLLDETEVSSTAETTDDDADDNEPSNFDPIDKNQLAKINAEADELGVDKRIFCGFLSNRWRRPIASMAAIPKEYFEDAMDQLERKRKSIERGDAQGEALL